MTENTIHGLPKRYLRLEELAMRWGMEPLDLLSYGIEGKLTVALLAYGSNVTMLPDSFIVVEDESKVSPEWLVSLLPKTLKAIASDGGVSTGRGYRWSEEGWEVISFSREKKITCADLVVPVTEITEREHGTALQSVPVDIPVSEAGKEIFQKQIAGLALVISKVGGNTYKKSGGKPNKSQIANAVLANFDNLPKDLHATLTLGGLSPSAIRSNIAKGLTLLGLTEEETKK